MAYLNRHPKARIVLQLLLDAAPFLLLLGFCCCMYRLLGYAAEMGWMMRICIWGFLLGAAPLWLLGRILRKRMDGVFACFARCACASSIMRTLGTISACWSILGLLLCLLEMSGI